MKAFTRMLKEDRDLQGHYTFNKGWWLYRFLNARIFRIGALEYEIVDKDNRKAISVHIPSDSFLLPEKISESLKEARKFFKDHFDITDVPFVCSSWLLSEDLDPFLKEDSNILNFKRRFIVKDKKENNEFIEFLYKCPENTPIEVLPEDTSLQRMVKKHLLAGGKVHWTTGVLADE